MVKRVSRRAALLLLLGWLCGVISTSVCVRVSGYEYVSRDYFAGSNYGEWEPIPGTGSGDNLLFRRSKFRPGDWVCYSVLYRYFNPVAELLCY